MSPPHFWLTTGVVKFCCKRFGATGRLWFEFVVALNLRAALALRPWRRWLAATVLRLQGHPCSCRSRVSVSVPQRPLRAAKTRATC
jgi:hypothetical protein